MASRNRVTKFRQGWSVGNHENNLKALHDWVDELFDKLEEIDATLRSVVERLTKLEKAPKK